MGKHPNHDKRVLLPFPVKKISFRIIHYFSSTYYIGTTAALIPVFLTGRPIIAKWGDYSTFKVPKVVLKDIKRLHLGSQTLHIPATL